MSGYYYPQHSSPQEEEEDLDFLSYQTAPARPQPVYHQQYGQQFSSPYSPQSQYYTQAQQTPQMYYQHPQQYQQQQWAFTSPPLQQQPWTTPTVPSNAPYQSTPTTTAQFPQYTEPPTTTYSSPEMSFAGPSRTSTGYLSPGEGTRISRATSFASNASSNASYEPSDASRSASPSAAEMMKWGRRLENGSWRCAYPGCTSRSTFSRGCDLRKHYKRHTKSLFCRYQDCPQAHEGGFSSKKDRARHEAKHDPQISCEWEGCNRLFSRMDNMVSSSCARKSSGLGESDR
jgi:hypothetical protein